MIDAAGQEAKHGSGAEVARAVFSRRGGEMALLGVIASFQAAALLQWMPKTSLTPGAVSVLVSLPLAGLLLWLWAPVLDYVQLPWLTRRFGQRRSWLILSFGVKVLAGIWLIVVSIATVTGGLMLLWSAAAVGVASILVSTLVPAAVAAYRVERAPSPNHQGLYLAIFGMMVAAKPLVWDKIGGGLILSQRSIPTEVAIGLYILVSLIFPLLLILALREDKPRIARWPRLGRLPFGAIDFARDHKDWPRRKRMVALCAYSVFCAPIRSLVRRHGAALVGHAAVIACATLVVWAGYKLCSRVLYEVSHSGPYRTPLPSSLGFLMKAMALGFHDIAMVTRALYVLGLAIGGVSFFLVGARPAVITTTAAVAVSAAALLVSWTIGAWWVIGAYFVLSTMIAASIAAIAGYSAILTERPHTATHLAIWMALAVVSPALAEGLFSIYPPTAAFVVIILLGAVVVWFVSGVQSQLKPAQ